MKKQNVGVSDRVHIPGGSPASSQGSPRNRHDVTVDSVIVPVEASDASPVRANTQSRTFTING
jgi:hypothetical protein